MPRCCDNESCVLQDKGRHAFLTTIRSDNYLVMLAQMATQLKKHHPTTPLLVFTMEGDLSPDVRWMACVHCLAACHLSIAACH